MKNKLSYKLIAGIFIISFLLSSITLYIDLSKNYDNEIQKFENELDNIKNNSLNILSQSIWDVNHSAVNLFLSNLYHDERIIYVKLDQESIGFRQLGVKKDTNIIKKEFELSINDNEEFIYLGKLMIIADLAPLFKKLRADAIYKISEEVLKIFLISILIVLFIKNSITNTLEDMAEYANNLNLKNLNEPLLLNKKNKAHNELDIVADSINSMRMNLLNEIKKSQEKDKLLANQSKLASMGEMIGNIAHQWRQPLNMISVSASSIRLKNEYNILDNEYIESAADRIVKNTQYLSQTIDDFRNFIKDDKQKKVFDLRSSINSNLQILGSIIKYNELILVLDINDDVSLDSYENELTQVFVNIINNAKDALNENKIEDKYIFIKVEKKENFVNIIFKDNALGIKSEIMDKIFEPYFTTKHQSVGTGLGLYMTHKIVTESLKGHIHVENVSYEYKNETHSGCQFVIKLPLT